MQKGGAPVWDAPPFSLRTGPLARPGRRRCLLHRWYYDPVAADRHDTEVVATVLLPAGFVVLGANRALLAVGHEVEAICRNAVVNEVPLGGSRTALAEGQVVLVGATLVSVTLDTDSHTRVSLQPRDLAIECSSRIRSDRRLVEVEVDRASDRRRVRQLRWRRHASRIGRQDARVVLAGCRRRRWRRRRGRSNAVRARSRNALEAGVRAHNLRTRTTKQEAQSATNVNVHVRVGLVIRHAIEDAVKPQRGAVGDAKTNAGQSTPTVVIGVAGDVGDVVLETVARARSTRADDELALPVQQPEREVVVQTQCECMGVDVADRRIRRRKLVGLWRVVAITFELPPGIGQEDTDATAVTKAVFGNGRAFDTGVVIEECPLREAAELHRSGQRRIELIPPHVRRKHHWSRGRRAAEEIAQIRRKLESGLSAEIKLATFGWKVIHQPVDTERDTTEAEVESGQSVDAELIRPRSSIG